jgi:hypothetical protein
VPTASYLNSWAPYNTPPNADLAYRKSPDGRVYMRGRCTRAAGDPGGNSTVFIIPTDYVPAYREIFVGGGSNGVTTIFTRFLVEQSGTDWLFRWGDGGWLNCHLGAGVEWDAADRRPVAHGAPFPLVINTPELVTDPAGLIPVRCVDVTSGLFAPAVIPRIQWEPGTSGGNRVVKITHAGGLAPNRKYQLYVLAFV